MTIVVIIEGVVIAVLGVLVLGLLRSHAEILRALHDLGSTLDPVRRTDASLDISGIDPHGRAVHVAVTGVDGLTLVAFLSSGCLSCRGFWERFAEPTTLIPGGAAVVVVTKGPEAESESLIRELAAPGITAVLSSDAWVSYGVPVAPYFVLVDGSGGAVVGEGAATSWEQVSDLMSRSLADAGLAAQRRRVLPRGPDGLRGISVQ